MNEELEGGRVEDKTLLKDAGLALVLSSVFHLLSFTSYFFVCPLLFFGIRHGKANYLKVAGLELLFVLGHSAYIVLPSDFPLFSLGLSLSIPVSLLAAGTIWLLSSGKKVEARLFMSFVPCILIFLGLGIALQADRALFEAVYFSYRDVFADLFSSLGGATGTSLDPEYLYQILAVSVATLIMPMTLVAVCATCFYYSNLLHSKESDWEERVAAMEFSPDLIWLLLLLVASQLLAYFVSLPIGLEIGLSSLLLTILLVYAAEGFTVLFTWVRRVSENMKSIVLLIYLLVAAFIVPGLNIIVLLGLPVLGVLENFFNLKKRKTQ